MAKYGSPSVGFLLVDGVNLLGTGSEVLSISGPEVEAILEETTGLGAGAPTHAAVGLKKATFGHEGFYDDAVGLVNEALNSNQAVQRIVSLGLTGNAVGAKFTGLAGAFAGKYARVLQLATLHKGKGDYTVSGAVDDGIVLQHLTPKTADWNTEGAESQDNGASTANGGAGYLHVTALTGFTGFIGKIRHSADDTTYADLLTFANMTAVGAQRVTVAGTVNRHLAFNGDVTGSGSITVCAGFARG